MISNSTKDPYHPHQTLARVVQYKWLEEKWLRIRNFVREYKIFEKAIK
jgi:2'-5' RNA ligase